MDSMLDARSLQELAACAVQLSLHKSGKVWLYCLHRAASGCIVSVCLCTLWQRQGSTISCSGDAISRNSFH